MENTNLNKALNEAGKFINERFKAEAKEKGHIATEKLDKSFRYTVVANELKFFSEEYAKAISGGVSKGNGNKEAFKRKMINIEEWASKKGIVPRDKNGKFLKRTKSAIRNMVFNISVGIGRNGISKRFGYKGSGFIQTVKDQTGKKLMEMIDEGYRKDLEAKLDTIKKTK